MEDWIIIYIVIFVIISIILSIFGLRQQIEQLNNFNKLLDLQAVKRNGKKIKKFQPRLIFSYMNCRVELGVFIRPGSAIDYTEINVDLVEKIDEKVKIYRKVDFSSFVKNKDLSKGLLIDIEFDKKFRAKSNDDFFVASLLEKDIVEKILELNISVLDISGSKMVIKIYWIPKTEEEYDMLLDLTTSVIDRLKELKKI